eukprot:361377-Chlamydomonas_euryale.AAC.4
MLGEADREAGREVAVREWEVSLIGVEASLIAGVGCWTGGRGWAGPQTGSYSPAAKARAG